MNTAAADASRSVVVLAYGEEAWLDDCLAALHATLRDRDELVVVDNGCTRDDLSELVHRAGGRVVTPAANLGYAGGCNAGARASNGDVLVFVNSDAVVDADCLPRLVRALSESNVGIACAKIVLADEPARINSIGNPVHVTGLTWSGGFGEQSSAYPTTRPVTSATGCVFAIGRELWDDLGGFWEVFFAYLEDTELSLRCRLHGLDVVCVGDAVARHHYEFSRNKRKMFLLERNRLLVLGTVLERGTLVRLAPVIVLFELLMLPLALAQGWGREKLRAWRWLVMHRSTLRRRRDLVQRSRTIDDAVIVPLLTRRLDPANVTRPPGMAVIDGLVRAWCAIVFRPRRTAG